MAPDGAIAVRAITYNFLISVLVSCQAKNPIQVRYRTALRSARPIGPSTPSGPAASTAEPSAGRR
jgi:hypothetical protein